MPPKKKPAKRAPAKQQPAKGAAVKPQPAGRNPRPTARAQRAEALRRRTRNRSILRAGAVLLLVAIGAAIALSRGGSTPAIVSASCTSDERFDGNRGNQSDHIPKPTYEVDPPAGGPHEPQAATPGFYEDGDRVPSDGQLVHAMEHGFVVLWYRPGLTDTQRSEVDALSDRFGRELIVVPRASLDGPVALTAWHRRLRCDAIDAEAAAEFVQRFRDQGPEKGFL